MNAVRVSLIAIVSCFGFSSSASGQQSSSGTPPASKLGFSISVDFNATEVMKAVTDAVSRITARWDKLTLAEKNDGVARLSLRLASIAGMEDALARSLEMYVKNPILAASRNQKDQDRIDRATVVFNVKLEEIRKAFSQVNDHLERLDPDWAKQNTLLIRSIGSFTHDGILFYQPPDRQWEALSKPETARDLVAGIRTEADGLAELARRLDSKLTS